jgi:hypothetical protein
MNSLCCILEKQRGKGGTTGGPQSGRTSKSLEMQTMRFWIGDFRTEAQESYLSVMSACRWFCCLPSWRPSALGIPHLPAFLSTSGTMAECRTSSSVFASSQHTCHRVLVQAPETSELICLTNKQHQKIDPGKGRQEYSPQKVLESWLFEERPIITQDDGGWWNIRVVP